MIGIYKATLKDSGECCYVGQSLNIKRRVLEHKRVASRGEKRSPFANAMRDLGPDAFMFHVVERCNPEQLDDREKFWIRELNPKYNLEKGGSKLDESARHKISQALSRVWHSRSEEEKERFRKHNLCGPRVGHPVSAETRQKLRCANTGHKQTAETRKKRSEALKARWAKTPKHKTLKAVVQITQDGRFVAFHKSVRAAAESVGCEAWCISRSMKRRSVSYGSFFIPLKQFVSVETSGDECSRVGREDESPLQVRGNHVVVEDIVRSAAMEKPQAVDKGLIQLALRTGQYKGMNAVAVNQAAFGGYDDIGDPLILWDKLDPAEEPIGYAFAWKTVNGFTKIIYWPKAKVEAHAKRYSQAYRSGYDTPWKTNFDPMALKTVVKDGLSHWGILSVEMRKALAEDQAVHADIDSPPAYPDNMTATRAKMGGDGAIETEVTVEVADDPAGDPPNEEVKPEPPPQQEVKQQPPAKTKAAETVEKPAETQTATQQTLPTQQPAQTQAPADDDDASNDIVTALSAKIEASLIPPAKFCAWACGKYKLPPVDTLEEFTEAYVARAVKILNKWDELLQEIEAGTK